MDFDRDANSSFDQIDPATSRREIRELEEKVHALQAQMRMEDRELIRQDYYDLNSNPGSQSPINYQNFPYSNTSCPIGDILASSFDMITVSMPFRERQNLNGYPEWHMPDQSSTSCPLPTPQSPVFSEPVDCLNVEPGPSESPAFDPAPSSPTYGAWPPSFGPFASSVSVAEPVVDPQVSTAYGHLNGPKESHHGLKFEKPKQRKKTQSTYMAPPMKKLYNLANNNQLFGNGRQRIPKTGNPFEYRPVTPEKENSRPKKRSPFALPEEENWSVKFFEDATTRKYGDKQYIDTHCHYDFIFEKMKYKGTVEEFESKNELTWSKTYEGCIPDYCEPDAILREDGSGWDMVVKDKHVKGIAFGCHPHWSNRFDDSLRDSLSLRLAHEKVVAVGECGFDFSYKNAVPLEVQQYAFESQIKLAQDLNKPLLIHCRGGGRDDLRGDAESLCLESVKKILGSDHPIHRHCFTLGMKEAEKWFHEFPNLYIGLTPVIIKPSLEREKVLQVVKQCPLDRIVIETDAPYFLPYTHRDHLQWSHPGIGITVALKIAEERLISVEKVLEQIRENTKKLYGI